MIQSRDFREDLYGLANGTGWEPYDLHHLTKVPGSDLYSLYKDPAQQIITAGTGSTGDDLDDLDHRCRLTDNRQVKHRSILKPIYYV